MKSKLIEEVELYKMWRYISHTISWKAYREKVLQNGWTLYGIETEANYERQRKAN